MQNVLETYASYVPVSILKQREHAPTRAPQPAAEHCPAAVLFADISGFTLLTEQLVQRGPDGIEELSIILNAYFGLLIDMVLDHGGDIIEFTGDGIIAVWPALLYDDDLPTLTYRAAQCGLVAQYMLQRYNPGDGPTLSLRIGIGAGQVLLATVGGMLGRWEVLLAGDPLAQASTAQEMAAPGDVVLSPEAWEQVQDDCIAYPLVGRERETSSYGFHLEQVRRYIPPQPVPPVTLVPEMTTAMRSYLPGALLARLDAGQSDWVAELRRVTILFVKVTGLNYDQSDILERLQNDLVLFQTDLYHYEGSLNQFIVDDKGTLLIAALGLPPLTHEDDPIRGVQLAMDIQNRPRPDNLTVSIGIATGRIFCGSRGSTRRRDYAMIGDVMNLAARLMQAAPGAILCDEATVQAARQSLSFDPLPPLHLKGYTEPVAVYRPHGPRRVDVCQRTPIVGRAHEQDLLRERLHTLANEQQGSVVIIEGDAGMGKSRLVDYALEQAQTLHIRSLIGRGSALEQSTFYHIWQGVFVQLFHLYDDDLASNPATAQEQVRQLLRDDPEVFPFAPLLDAVLPFYIPDNDRTAQMSGQVRADNTRDILIRVLQTAAEHTPTLLVLEDANWMDSASWALTIAVSQHIPSLMLVITTRPLSDPVSGIALLRGNLEFELSRTHDHDVRIAPKPGAVERPDVCVLPPHHMAHVTMEQTEYGHLLKRPDAYHLVLESLPHERTATLVGQCLGVQSVPEPVTAIIAEKAQGNPFFCQELAYALRDNGLIEVQHGECRLVADNGDLSTLRFPDTVQGVIISRIDRLTQGQQLTIKVASVIGHLFAYHTLHDIHPIEADRPRLTEQLRLFERLDIVLREQPDPDILYAFKHTIIREAVYDLLLFAQRRELHRAVAEWYEHTSSGNLSHLYELLLHHWSKADVPERVLYYAEKAGEHALRNFANQEAVHFFSQALTTLETSGDESLPRTRSFDDKHMWQASLERQLGEAYLGLGNIPAARRHLERAAALVGRAIPASRLLLVGRIGRQTARQMLHRMVAVRPERLTREQRMHMGLAAHIYGLLTSVYYLTNESLLAIYTSVRSLNLAERAAPRSRWLAYTYANMCIAAGGVRLHALAVFYGRNALDVAWTMGDIPSLVYALNLNALYRVGVGHWRHARSALQLAVHLCERLGDHTTWGTNWTLLAQVAYYRGEFAQSFAMFEQLQAAAERRDNRLHQAWALGGQGQNALRLGHLEQACTLLESAITRLAENDELPSQISNYGLLAMARLRLGEHDKAEAAASTAATMIASIPLPTVYYLIEGYAGVVEVYAALWEAAAAESANRRPSGGPPLADLVQRTMQASEALRGFADLFPIAQPRAWLWRGMVAWLRSKPHRAHAAWRKSLAAAERLAMPYEQGLAHLSLARYTGDSRQRTGGTNDHDHTRRHHLERAAVLFAQVGAGWELARTRHEQQTG